VRRWYPVKDAGALSAALEIYAYRPIFGEERNAPNHAAPKHRWIDVGVDSIVEEVVSELVKVLTAVFFDADGDKRSLRTICAKQVEENHSLAKDHSLRI
jgi:hypothetical protein